VARVKQTGRADARRRYRQATSEQVVDDGAADELDFGERKPAVAAPPSSGDHGAREAQPAGRMGFMAAFRAAYHPVRLRDDLRALPQLLRSRALLLAVGMVLLGAVAVYIWPNYTGTAMAWELLVLPGSALAPQLVAGFFAPRASYLLGLIVGLVQGVTFTLFLSQFASRLGTTLPADQMSNLLTLSFVTGPISGTLFAAAAAWYRRFLALSNPRRTPPGRTSGRPSGRQAPRNSSRRPASR
jgi:hypothetical protein